MINRDLIQKLAEMLKNEHVDALMAAPGHDLVFLLGHSPYLCERFQTLVITAKGEAFYICNRLTEAEAIGFMDGNKVYQWMDSEGFTETVKKAFEEHNLIGKRIAVNGTVRAFNLIKLMETFEFTPVNGKHYLEMTRIIKTPEELENLRISSQIVDKAFEDIIHFIKPGMSEKDIKNELARLCMHYGADAFMGGIVAVDANAANPHYFGDSAIIGEHAVVEMDYGCTYKGMFSDITRTVIVGKATDREKEIYNLVLKANLAGEAAAVNGAWIPDVDMAARKVIEEAGYGYEFNHRLGHGIGYAGHEAPYIHGDNKMHLAPGMAFSCEPGIYIRNEIGVRIEDVVIINEKGETEVLNKCTKELVEIF
ncbi:MAG: aminopeptidase P family protein [Erysipelotrichaceae bacterium]|nr:aminopeptidase P family protein [Erysipelotrichaceae bacterium]